MNRKAQKESSGKTETEKQRGGLDKSAARSRYEIERKSSSEKEKAKYKRDIKTPGKAEKRKQQQRTGKSTQKRAGVRYPGGIWWIYSPSRFPGELST